ncbi:MAG: indole-3-glycerol-phosphate synthase [Nitrososphaeria archaeon]|nr:indole-3-glycerol-phosphate synthase [Nitrososphaeria archaeon]NIN51881.1 indole-3-glycerol-phosphate synthase [Nitrososphaeria archaeon]NIQ32429.1 indole-3-glycerol-phosphate synthase [Nitrososphaeria archaeon]
MDFLKQIIDDVRLRVSRDYKNYAARPIERRRRSLIKAIRNEKRASIISEIKPASPSKGILRYPLDAGEVAHLMEEGGAVAVSVLTEPQHFKGSLDNLLAARRVVDLPILMKDFFVDEKQIHLAAESGADAVLLLPSICELSAFIRRTHELGLEALVEVHDEGDVEAAAQVGAGIIGINNRDLSTLRVDLHKTAELIPVIRRRCRDAVIVSESGISTPRHVQYVLSKGVDAVLVGTSIMRSADVKDKVRSLVECI